MNLDKVHKAAKTLRVEHALLLNNALRVSRFQGKPFTSYNGHSDDTLAKGLLFADAAAHHIGVVVSLSYEDKKKMFSVRKEVRGGIQRYCQELARVFFPSSPDLLHYKSKPQATEGLPSKVGVGVCSSNAVLNLIPSFTHNKGSLNNLLLAPLLDFLLLTLKETKQFSKLTPEYSRQKINQEKIDAWLANVEKHQEHIFRTGKGGLHPDDVQEDLYTVAQRTSIDIQKLLTSNKEEPIKVCIGPGELIRFGEMLYIAKQYAELEHKTGIDSRHFRKVSK